MIFPEWVTSVSGNATCKYCGERVVWTKTKNGKSHCFNATPLDGGFAQTHHAT